MAMSVSFSAIFLNFLMASHHYISSGKDMSAMAVGKQVVRQERNKKRGVNTGKAEKSTSKFRRPVPINARHKTRPLSITTQIMTYRRHSLNGSP
jgi:hypothetical protein